MATREQWIERAREEYAGDDVNVDDDAQLSHTDDGAWVQAWVFVADGGREG